jgi:hypothetical protein
MAVNALPCRGVIDPWIRKCRLPEPTATAALPAGKCSRANALHETFDPWPTPQPARRRQPSATDVTSATFDNLKDSVGQTDHAPRDER